MLKISIVSKVKSIENSKTLKYHTFSIKHYFFLLRVISVLLIMKQIFEEVSIEISEILGLINNNNMSKMHPALLILLFIFSPNEYETMTKITYNSFKDKYDRRKDKPRI